MGAYLAVIAAVGLDLDLRLPNDTVAISDPPRERSAALPARIRLDDHPALKRLAWQGQGVDEISPVDALHLYERNWRHIDPADLGSAERALIRTLAEQLSAGRLLV